MLEMNSHVLGQAKAALARLRIELVQQLRPELHEENHFGREALGGGPGAPVGRIDADLEMDEA